MEKREQSSLAQMRILQLESAGSIRLRPATHFRAGSNKGTRCGSLLAAHVDMMSDRPADLGERTRWTDGQPPKGASSMSRPSLEFPCILTF